MIKNKKTISLAFVIGYLVFFYIPIEIAVQVFDNIISDSWIILGECENRMKIILSTYPIIVLFFGLPFAGIFIRSYTAMGADRLTFSKVIIIGWTCLFVSNRVILPVIVQLFIDKEYYKPWIEAVGGVYFNVLFFLIAPTIGFIGGLIFVLYIRFIRAYKK
jgi:hypothetical protein